MNKILSHRPAHVLDLGSGYYISISKLPEAAQKEHLAVRFSRSLKIFIAGVARLVPFMGTKVNGATFKNTSGMQELEYHGLGKGPDKVYRLLHFEERLPWLVLESNLMVAMLEKKDGCWSTVGKCILASSDVEALTAFIDKSSPCSLRTKIMARWPEAVQEVIRKNESVYLVICRPGICFHTFRRVFPQFISQIHSEGATIEFNVYNERFDSDFIVRIF